MFQLNRGGQFDWWRKQEYPVFVVGAHTLGYNRLGLAASFMGNFMTYTPRKAALDAVKALIQCGISKGKISYSYALLMS
jgi:hypothetical protein